MGPAPNPLPTQWQGTRPVKLGRVEPTRKWRLETADAVAGGAASSGPFRIRPTQPFPCGVRCTVTPPAQAQHVVRPTRLGIAEDRLLPAAKRLPLHYGAGRAAV